MRERICRWGLARAGAWAGARSLAFVFALVAAFAGVCGAAAAQAQPHLQTHPQPSAIAVADDFGQTVRLAQPAQRVVSLLPSLTETVCALGTCERLVGTDRYSNWPAQVLTLPRVGGGLDPSIERIVALRPDVVLMAGSARGAERLQALGVVVVRLEPRTHADVQRVLHTVAQVLGLPVAQPERVWQQILADVQAVAQSLSAQARRQRVYIEATSTPHGASESSFVGELLQRMGVANVVPAALGPFPQLNPEFVLRAQPDVVLVSQQNHAQWPQRPGWGQLAAVQAGRVCALPAAQADALVRAGPRMAEAARTMAQCLQRTTSSNRGQITTSSNRGQLTILGHWGQIAISRSETSALTPMTGPRIQLALFPMTEPRIQLPTPPHEATA